ncbi:hypothetical protein C8Q75DRAFT_868571 [Abortiporus biennis]|nr:hypothetical protein C8Q75DRAFT_868571 [Abortiporus biennis]
MNANVPLSRDRFIRAYCVLQRTVGKPSWPKLQFDITSFIRVLIYQSFVEEKPIWNGTRKCRTHVVEYLHRYRRQLDRDWFYVGEEDSAANFLGNCKDSEGLIDHFGPGEHIYRKVTSFWYILPSQVPAACRHHAQVPAFPSFEEEEYLIFHLEAGQTKI